MADLESLIRYRQYAVDEKRRALAVLYRQAADLEKRKEAIEEEIRKETELAEEMASAESSAYLGRYLEGARKKIADIETSMRKLEVTIAIAQEDMRSAFAEMKKIEIVRRNRKTREETKENKKEAQELDDIAIEQFRRRDEES